MVYLAAQPVRERTQAIGVMRITPVEGLGDARFLSWLHSLGLAFDPFRVLDAGQDPQIPYYIIDHAANDLIRGLNSTYVFAPPGGGKSAFRVHLAHTCRSNEDDRRIFPIIFKPDETLDVGWQALAQAAAQDLFIFILYHLLILERMSEEGLRALRQHLDWNLPAGLDLYIDQLRSYESIDPVIDAFDPTARLLPNPPEPADILEFCDLLERIPAAGGEPANPQEKFDAITDFIFHQLDARAIFLLIDGADAFYETVTHSDATFRYLEWLFDHESDLSTRKIYLKYFLPSETKKEIEIKLPRLLKNNHNIVMIEWNEDSLIRVIQERLLVASGGKVKNLDAVSTNALRGAEQCIVNSTRPYPRAVIERTEQLFKYHCEHFQGKGKLTPEDIEAVTSSSK